MFELNLSDTSKQVKFKIDSNKIHLLQQILQDNKTDINKKEIELIDDFSYIEDGQLLFPCPNIEWWFNINKKDDWNTCLLYTSPSPRDRTRSRMPSSA